VRDRKNKEITWRNERRERGRGEMRQLDEKESNRVAYRGVTCLDNRGVTIGIVRR
jgi:hypothetical protein